MNIVHTMLYRGAVLILTDTGVLWRFRLDASPEGWPMIDEIGQNQGVETMRHCADRVEGI